MRYVGLKIKLKVKKVDTYLTYLHFMFDFRSTFLELRYGHLICTYSRKYDSICNDEGKLFASGL